jgi:CheY-like chemotaxis protein
MARLGSSVGGSGGNRLLLVEDEFLIRLTLSETLLDAGYDVIDVADADEAMARLDQDGADAAPLRLLLTDVQLPGPIDGHALAARLRETLPELPVIFMTGRPDPGSAAGSVRRDLFIAKPYLPSEVVAAVGRLLGS